MASPPEHIFARQSSKQWSWGEAHVDDPRFTVDTAPGVATELALWVSFVPQLGDCYGRAKLQTAARARRVKESAQSVRRLTLMQRLAGWFGYRRTSTIHVQRRKTKRW